MKTSKLFTIDIEIAERLTTIDNSSALVNELLGEYFRVRSGKRTGLEQKKAIITDLKKKPKQLIKNLRSWKSSTLWNSIISVLSGFRKSGSTENQKNTQLKNIVEGETSIRP